MVEQKSEHVKWYHLIDAFRGFALLNMLFFHFFYSDRIPTGITILR